MSRHFGLKPTIIVSDYIDNGSHICTNATGGRRCDICFGEITEDETDMASVRDREAAVISWLTLCAAAIGVTLAVSTVIVSALISLD